MTAVRARKPARPNLPKPAQAFVAAVRYPDGRRELFHVLNADNLADAREMVLLEVGDVRSLLIAARC